MVQLRPVKKERSGEAARSPPGEHADKSEYRNRGIELFPIARGNFIDLFRRSRAVFFYCSQLLNSDIFRWLPRGSERIGQQRRGFSKAGTITGGLFFYRLFSFLSQKNISEGRGVGNISPGRSLY